MKKIHIGDTLALIPETFSPAVDEKSAKRPLKCKVVYIHPKGRYFTVEFEKGVRESYHFSKMEG